MRLLCWFSRHRRYNNFRIQELESLAYEEGVNGNELWSSPCSRPFSESDDIFVYCNIPSVDVARKIQQRSLLIRGFLEVWAEGRNYEDIRKKLFEDGLECFKSHINKDLTWAFKIVACSKALSQEYMAEKMAFFSCLFCGDERVSLDHPDTTLVIIEDWIHHGNGEPTLKKIYFTRAVSQREKKKQWWLKFMLTKRPVLGPTTLDTELAFLMCNQALVKRGALVMDPFVGTGSIIIAATHLGGLCFGADIDIRVLKGWGISYVNPSLETAPNVKQRCKEACEKWRPWLDAIIADPPYGIRAAARKGGQSKKFNCVKRGDNYIFPTTWYDSRQTIVDLLQLASSLLVDGGRLVFLLLVEASELE
ncbi:hypothetical protein IE077_000498 [Cardiosporidium cionae]|uniref:Uncharacterized protein n=1 Tax=Cardiosporidium cionae TaxID=476202 RepID=A0ABQ7JFA3_9APIC|nr:hypothetical protein IE077_000498 [Cardiosporidium cionae]|eukprot:KAF8822648.1 hypothetical protein IE077_000498 [Cardiosporidium cionae]